MLLLMCCGLNSAWAVAEMPPSDSVSEMVAEEEVVPFAALPQSARIELNHELLTIWEQLDQGGESMDARLQLLTYLRSVSGRKLTASKQMNDSYMYHVLLGKAGILAGSLDRLDESGNKGLHWFVHGLLRIYENKSTQASGNFVKGMFSSLHLVPEDYQRLADNGIKVKYFPSMNPYSNSAFLAAGFVKMIYADQQAILNVAMARKVLNMAVNPEEFNNPQSQSYQLLGLYYNLGAFLVLEGYNDLYAIEEFYDQPDDLFNILRDKFEFDSRDVLKGRYGE